MPRPKLEDESKRKTQHKFYCEDSTWDKFKEYSAKYGMTSSQLLELLMLKFCEKNSTLIEALELKAVKKAEREKILEVRKARETGQSVQREVEGQTELDFGEVIK